MRLPDKDGEYVLRVFKDGERLCSVLVKVKEGRVNIHISAFTRLLNRLLNKCKAETEIKEVLY